MLFDGVCGEKWAGCLATLCGTHRPGPAVVSALTDGAFKYRAVAEWGMRELTTFRSGPDGTVILAPTPGDAYEYDDLDVALSGRTIELRTPDGEQEVSLEVVHGELA